ncbi:MAG: hypothetical protein ABI972_21105 [Acidobacteriota bacterium]
MFHKTSLHATVLRLPESAHHGVVRMACVILLASALIPGLSAAPVITGMGNAGSNILANSPLAQGSIFIIYGTGLGPATLATASSAFQTTTLSGTSITVTVGTITVNALMYYTSDGQLAALLPSSTPTGTGAFTVTYNGQTSPPVNRGIAASNVGVFTITSNGQGPAIVTYPDYSLVSAAKGTPCGGPNTYCGAANPGDTLILWATGLGPVSGSDAAGAGLGLAMPNVPLRLFLGGVQANIIYQGRSGCCIGEDQIVFTVPANAPTGCAVPLVLQVGTTTNTVSNTSLLPVATTGRNCTATNPVQAPLIASIMETVMANRPLRIGEISLQHQLNGFNPPVYRDRAGFEFVRVTSYVPGTQPFFATWLDEQPVGTCSVNGGTEPEPPIGGLEGINGGSTYTVSGPNGVTPITLPSGQSGIVLSATGTYLIPGVYTVTGPGGPDSGPINASLTIPSAPRLLTPVNNSTVTRANGLTATWTGGSQTGNLRIRVSSYVDSEATIGAEAICIAPASAGTFTIPPYVLLALPAGGFAGFSIGPATISQPYSATGLDVGILEYRDEGVGYGFGAGTGGFRLQ